MPLIRPTAAVQTSFLAAMREFEEEGRGGPGDDSMVGRDIRERRGVWETAGGFEEYVRWLVDQAREDAPRPAEHVPSTTLWWVEATEYLGRITIRHRLTPPLIEIGGHIGYDIRRSRRGRGHASAMLREALPLARGLGIDPALITCDEDNLASRAVIERNGGVLEDRRGGTRRYWVATS